MKFYFDLFIHDLQSWFEHASQLSTIWSTHSDHPTRGKIVRAGHQLGVVTVFLLIGLFIVNPSIRTQINNSLFGDSNHSELASADIENNALDTPSLKMVSYTPSVASPLNSEIMGVPVPSIAGLANQIPTSSIDPKAIDQKLMVTIEDQQKVADFMAYKYRIDPKDVRQYVNQAMVVSKEVGLDPVLIVAVMAIESRFNPFAQSGAGAQGLMQVLTRVHTEKYIPYGGTSAAFKPEANIRVGAYILKGYIAQSGSLQGGLRYYVGGAYVGDGGYAGKVLREKEQLVSLLKGEISPVNEALKSVNPVLSLLNDLVQTKSNPSVVNPNQIVAGNDLMSTEVVNRQETQQGPTLEMQPAP